MNVMNVVQVGLKQMQEIVFIANQRILLYIGNRVRNPKIKNRKGEKTNGTLSKVGNHL